MSTEKACVPCQIRLLVSDPQHEAFCIVMTYGEDAEPVRICNATVYHCPKCGAEFIEFDNEAIISRYNQNFYTFLKHLKDNSGNKKGYRLFYLYYDFTWSEKR